MGLSIEILVQIAYALGVGVLIGIERSLDVVLTEEPPAKPDTVESDETGDGEPAAPGDAVGGDGESSDAGTPEARRAEAGQSPGDVPPEEPVADKDAEAAGVRTFAVLSLLGYGGALVGEQIDFAGAIVLGVVGLLVVAMYFRASGHGHGITTESAAVAVCMLGMLCRFHPEVAGVLALLITVLLASKRFTHSTVAKMRRVELTDTLKFLVVILIALPLLPDQPLDPWEVFNPQKVGLLVVLISGIGYAGYFLTRILGPQRGLALTGIVGGLTSSTAVTAAMANQAKERPEWSTVCVVATVAANATMFVRVLLVVAVLDVQLVMRLAWSVGGMAVTAVLATVLLWFQASRSKQTRDARDSKDRSQVKLKNPFSVGPAIKFAIFFVFILFVLKLAQQYLGDLGLWAAAALSGLADVDAITLSLSEQASADEIARRTAAIAITIAVVSNSATKTGIAIYSGGWRFGRMVAACLGLATIVGLGLALVV